MLISHILDDLDHVLTKLGDNHFNVCLKFLDSFWIVSTITSFISPLKSSDARGSMSFESDESRFFSIGANARALESPENSFTNGDCC